MLVNLPRRFDRVVLAGERARLFEIGEEQIDRSLDQLPEQIALQADDERIRDRQRDLHAVLLGDLDGAQRRRARRVAR